MAAESFTLESFLKSDHVPTLPEIALRVVSIAQQPDPDLEELVYTIRADPAISGRLLRFANSALFGLRCRATSIESAIPILGSTLVRTLTLGFILARQTSVSESLQPWFRHLWKESLFEASAAELFADSVDGADPPTWFLTGLLQDIGQLVMLNVAQADYYRHVLENGRTQCRLQLEREHFGFTHVDVSASLCRRWNFEDEMVAAVETHHGLPENDEPDYSPLQFASAAASACLDYMEATHDRVEVARDSVVRFLIRGYGHAAHDIPEQLAEMDCRAHELAAGFSVDVGEGQSRERILARAQRALSNIAVESQVLLARQSANA